MHEGKSYKIKIKRWFGLWHFHPTRIVIEHSHSALLSTLCSVQHWYLRYTLH